MNTQEQIKATRTMNKAQAQIDELEASTKQPEPWNRWRAERGCKYYFVDDEGYTNVCFENNEPDNGFHYASGNYFKTEEEARLYKDTMLAKQEFKDMDEGYEFVG